MSKTKKSPFCCKKMEQLLYQIEPVNKELKKIHSKQKKLAKKIIYYSDKLVKANIIDLNGQFALIMYYSKLHTYAEIGKMMHLNPGKVYAMLADIICRDILKKY
jgi:hypothetical protein